jgi:hypothetical protein
MRFQRPASSRSCDELDMLQREKRVISRWPGILIHTVYT